MYDFEWRDEFAAMALIGELASQYQSYVPPFEDLSKRCYDIGEAMVAERKKRMAADNNNTGGGA